MEEILPETVNVAMSGSIEFVYSFEPLARKTVILGKKRYTISA